MRVSAIIATLVALCFFTSPASAEKRVALVIGNTEYETQGKLNNPSNDAKRLGALLVKMGFVLVGGGPLLDLDKSTFDRALAKYGSMAENADVTLFYYSGHGMQVGGTNYLFPTDAPYVERSNLNTSFIDAGLVVKQVANAGSRLNLIILDACRNNPLLRKGKADASEGLAEMRAPAGTMIIFATQPGNLASDGVPGTNGPYAAALFTTMQRPGLDQFRVMNETALDVMRRTEGVQQPWMSASPITNSFYFTPPLVNVASTQVTGTLAQVLPQPAPAPATIQPAVLTSIQTLNGSAVSFTQEANLRFQQRDYAGGRAILTAGIQKDSRSALAYSYRGFAYYQDGLNNSNPHESLRLYRSGFEDLDMAIKLEPSYPATHRHRGNMIVASYKALKKTGQRTNNILDNAVNDLSNATKLDPTSSMNAYYLGEAYNLKGDYASAIQWFNKSLELQPKLVAPHAGICYALRMQGDIDGAKKRADDAARRDSGQAGKTCLFATNAWDRYIPPF